MAKRKLSPKQKAALAKGRKKAAANRKKKAKKKRSKKKTTKRRPKKKTTKRKATKRKAKKRTKKRNRVAACASLLGKASARKRGQKARGVRTKALSDSEQKKILNAALRGL